MLGSFDFMQPFDMQKVRHLLGTYNLGNMMTEIEGKECS